ncbi:MAG: hypothetical protein JO256_05260 [Alphaproteobacteria bacterium]|nr:hypothetical protein [Alphaproteobacteria bacterium]
MKRTVELWGLAAALVILAGCGAAAPPPAPAAVPAQPARPAAPTTPAPAQISADSLPDGPGKGETVAACSGCHGLGQLTGEHRNAQQWQATVISMINNGAPVSDGDFDKVVGYLAAHF